MSAPATAGAVLAGAVLAGGAGRRFGGPKAAAAFDDEPLVHRPLRALQSAGADPVLLVGGDPMLVVPGAVHVADDEPGGGPLPALVQALHLLAAADLVVVLACDLPGASSTEVEHLVAAWSADVDVIVSVVDGRRQWLHAAWSVGVLPALMAAVRSGERSLHGAADGLRVLELAPIETRALVDVDRREDLDRYARAERKLEGGP